MKQCSKCLETKPFSEFYREKRFAIGYQATCKECMRKHKREARLANPNMDHEYYLKNKDRLLLQKKVKYATDDEHRKRISLQQKQYYQKNCEKIKTRVKAYTAQNQEKVTTYQKAYRSNPENILRSNAASRRYRAKVENKKALALRQALYTYRKLNAPGNSTKAQLKARWDYYGGKCWICTDDAREMDHVKPLTKGGSHWPGNLRPICRSCNARKSNTWPYILTNRL